MMLTDTEITEAETRRWVERFEQHLDQVPMLVETIRDQANPLKAGSLNERVSGGGGEAPLPFRVDPIDDCDDLWASLVEYIGEVAERLQDAAPGAAGAAWAVSGSIRGIPARMTPDDAYKATYELIAWLIDRARRVRMLQLDDSESHLFGLIRKLSKRYVDAPPIERPAHRRTCSICGERAVLVAWLLGDTGEAECRVCGAVYAPEGMGENDE